MPRRQLASGQGNQYYHLVAKHEDKGDKDQTVMVEKPGNPATPTPSSTAAKDGTPPVQTGDDSMLVPLVMLLVAAGCFATALAMIRRRYASC